jgi:hypothetical protein
MFRDRDPITCLHATIFTVKLGYSNIGFCDTLSIASNIQWYALIPHKAYSFITTLFLGPFDDVITKFYCIYIISSKTDLHYSFCKL